MAGVQTIDHVFSDVALKFPILNAAGIAVDMKHHLLGLRYRVTDCRKILHEIIVIRRQSKRSRQWLVACVAMGYRMQRGDAGVGLGLSRFRARFDGAPVPNLTSLVALNQNRTPSHFRLPYLKRSENL